MEIKTNKRKRFNQPFWGLLFGLLVPTICFFAIFLYYYFSATTENFNLTNYYSQLIKDNILIHIITICALPNFILYIIFKKLDYWYAIKGIVASFLIFVIIAVILKFV